MANIKNNIYTYHSEKQRNYIVAFKLHLIWIGISKLNR
jgi:hypothetical protein